MRKPVVLLVALTIPLLATACNQQRPDAHVTSTITSTTATAPVEALSELAQGATVVASGKVVETMNTAGYTYVQIDSGGEKVWAAAPECAISVGDQVTIPAGMPMRDYHSNTLNRDFDLVYFVETFHTGDKPLSAGNAAAASLPPTASSSPPPAEVDVSGIETAEGGKTVSEIYAGTSELSGKSVTVRGKVVKFARQIMGKNWLHLRDGSGDATAGTHDLTVTTSANANVGDTVLVTGVVNLDKDFGFGYKYDVIIEDAKVVVE